LDNGIVADPAIHDPIELVNEGEIFFAEKGHADYKPKRPYHDRVAKVMFNASRAWRSTASSNVICLRCGMPFEGRKGTKYCSANCRKRAHEETKIVSR
jgi:hypothetical protein